MIKSLWRRFRERLLSILMRSLRHDGHGDARSVVGFMADIFGDGDLLRGSLTLDSELYSFISREAGRASTSHPKLKHLKYDQWFANHCSKANRVMDIGCGRGEVARAIAESNRAHVLGIDIDMDKVRQCREKWTLPNLSFEQGDALSMAIDGIDTVVLSNVLEHIEPRTQLLTKLKRSGIRLLLVRVPQYDRDWRVPVKKDYGIDYRLDPTHVLEYTEEMLDKELAEAGWRAEQKTFRWGEIWARCVPA